ncbi:uncharacterized protein LOC115775118 [Archocentrus centrarchus]|uniref:uncharacterized protein LOC115775118 n=1 Tax=Archocentrus centrarchus TaxID=63155 RepID=UPI0011E9D25D|nr:uncharacterized protein LOC115775118 [Archocentrus centrarchus]
MFPSLLLLSCLFLTVEYNHGQVLPPRNVSLSRIDDFDHALSWLPPRNHKGCKYIVVTNSGRSSKTLNNFMKLHREMEGGVLNVSISSKCNNSESKPLVISETNPDLVMDFHCYVHSPTQTNCSWSPTSVTPDLHMFYRYVVEGEGEGSDQLEIKECSSYIYTDGMKTGCFLPVTSKHSINILFNATLNNKTVRNTFCRDLIKFVRPPPLTWRVEKIGDGFNISWDAPEVLDLDQWTFIINYTRCNEDKIIIKRAVTSLQLSRASHCKYSMAIKAESGENGETPWSDKKYFDADAGSYVLVCLAVIIPLVIATLTVLTVMCYQKNKANIFPKVPEPRDLLSDICENNNKITLCNFKVPPMEEDSCKIALVIDPQISKPDS